MLIPPHLLNEHFNDRYFDVVNAIEEAKIVFFRGCNIDQKLSSLNNGNTFRIGETGFGAGRIVLSLIDFLQNNNFQDLSIIYNTVELYPISHIKMSNILDQFRNQIGSQIDLLVNAYQQLDLSISGWHRLQMSCSFGSLTLNLWVGEALEMVNELIDPCDAWFLDGHGPKKNPSAWRPELLKAIGQKTKKSGTCATYTVAGEVRRGLMDAGFCVERVPGFGGKKAVLKGIKK